MKKLLQSVSAKFNDRTYGAIVNVSNAKDEGYVDLDAKILIFIFIGALLLSGLYILFDGTIMPAIIKKVQDLLSYNG
jgi:hypothetical protein